MKEQLAALWATMQEKVYDNREVLIRVGCALAGAAVGSVITSAIHNQQSMNALDFLTEMETEATAEQ